MGGKKELQAQIRLLDSPSTDFFLKRLSNPDAPRLGEEIDQSMVGIEVDRDGGRAWRAWYQSLVTRGRTKQEAVMAGKDASVGTSAMSEENIVVERGRDLLPPPGGKKAGRGHSKSRDAVASLDGRACILEEAMGDVKDRLGMVEQNLQTLEDHVLDELESLKKAVTTQDELRTQFMELFASLQEQLDVEDLLFNFIDGLQNWAKQELQRRSVKDLDEAIAVAESLMEYVRVGDSSKGKNVQAASKGNHAKGGGDKLKAWHKGNHQAGTNRSEGQGKLEERRAKNKPKDGCFFCGGPHWARDCPRQGKLNALIEEKGEPEEDNVQMGSLQILNALHAKPVAKVPSGEGQASTRKGLLYVEAKLNGKPTKVMVDTGATHNFVTREEATRLGLKVVSGGGWLKSVNTDAKPLQGTARQVEMCLGTWRGLVDFSVAPMDDFKVVIGLDFLRQVNALVSPYSNAVHIMEKGASCVVPMSAGTSSAKALSSMQLSAMQLVKGIKKGETTYLAALKMEDNAGIPTEPLPREIEEVLEAIKEWEAPAKVSELRSFLGLANYYRRFIKGYSAKATPLTDLLKKGKTWEWSKRCQSAFEGLKTAVMEEPVLALPDHTKIFEVQTDASDFAIGGVLMQEGHPIAFESRKLNDTERRSEATNQSPFEIVIGQQPLTPLALAGDHNGRSPLAMQVARSWNEQADMARSYLDKAARKMKKWADKRRRPKEYNLGDMVMLKLLPQQFKSFRKVHKGLIRRYEGPFPIVAKVGKVSYRLKLPPKLKIHPVFHVSLLKPHYADMEDPSRGESHRAPTAVVKSYDKEAEYVLSDKLERRRDPRESETLRPADMHHGMEVRLGLSKGPVNRYLKIESEADCSLSNETAVEVKYHNFKKETMKDMTNLGLQEVKDYSRNNPSYTTPINAEDGDHFAINWRL
ncbi:hypothetical protein RJ640_020287 [Escallonia rubra]|uniref:Reverse transcriptase/retrotransposon-derived protein RNase H-like domain-containing protein n=1 Tax=Escallonia rubra TaxID=112253 RepID=A0AA88UP53_9ASTE|nr:hypothetical protein RJ640_020287 [Escallonia rubra]